MLLLPKETDATDFKNNIGSENASTETAEESTTTTDLSTVVNSDNLIESSLEQQQAQINNVPPVVVPTDDSPKFDQYILDSITAAASTSSITSITASTGFQNYCANGALNAQSTDPHEMPQLLNILNELLDGQDISSLANSGGNGDNIQDIEDQEENYEDDSPRKDDPEEIAKQMAQQKLEVISREEQQLRRRMDFLIRRLFKLVARSSGLHVSEEMAGFLEHVARYSKKKENVIKSPTKLFPSYLSGNLPGTPTELLTSPTFSQEPPLNLLSSPMTGIKTQDDDKQSLPTQQNNNNNNSNTAATTQQDVIEPSDKKNLDLKPVPLKEMKSFLRRIDNIATMQSTVLTKKALAFKYFSKTSPTSLNNLNSSLSSSKIESNFSVSAIPKLEDADVDQVEQTSGLLMNELRLIENQIDSDATASSTGGESADEMTIYNNHYQQPLSISKRAAYKYSKDRGAVATRWCWLATQISELDYKIRQHTDLRKHIRENKGIVTLEPINQHEGQRTSATTSTSFNKNNDSGSEDLDGGSAARVRPLAKSLFRKRKLVQITNLHHVSKKAARPSTLKCGCNWPLQPCALCTARVDPTAPRELMDVLPETERVALLDPGFHPVLSFPEDVSSSIHLEAIMNIPEWQSKMIRSSPKSIMKHATKQLEMLSGGNNGTFKDDFKLFGLAKPNAFEINEKKLKKGNIDANTGKRKYTKRFLKLEGNSNLGNKLKERKKYKKRRASLAMGQNPNVPRKYTFKKRLRKSDGTPINSMHNPPNGLNFNDKYGEPVNRSKNSSPIPNNRSEKSVEARKSRNYDIDNIVIPYSVAAATRIELLSYKEIPTPKWRILTDNDEEVENEEDQCQSIGENEVEDISDDSICLIHEKALLDERKKFETYLKFPLTSRSRANRRIDSRGNESSGANTPTPDQTSPPHVADIESIPSPLDNTVFHDTPSITALINNINGRKERKRTVSKKDEVHDGGGYSSGIPSRCISPETFRESIPAYEPLHFPLSDVSFHRLKRMMPTEHLKHNNNDNNKFYMKPVLKEETSHHTQHQNNNNNNNLTSSTIVTTKHTTQKSLKKPSSSLATIGKNNNLLIPRNNHTILNSIDLKGTDGAALKKLMNNNNGDLTNGDSFDELDDDNSDSETVTGDESLFEPDEEDSESEEYLDDDMEMDRKMYSNNKKKSSLIA